MNIKWGIIVRQTEPQSIIKGNAHGKGQTIDFEKWPSNMSILERPRSGGSRTAHVAPSIGSGNDRPAAIIDHVHMTVAGQWSATDEPENGPLATIFDGQREMDGQMGRNGHCIENQDEFNWIYTVDIRDQEIK
jgi:hypothetical protein